MQVEVKRLYIRDWHGRFAHVPGSQHALGTTLSGEEIAPLVAAKGWSRVDPRLVEKEVAADLAGEIGAEKARVVAQRLAFGGRLPRTYTNGSIALRISPNVDPAYDQKMLLDTAYMTHVAPLENVDVRIDDDFVRHGSGEDLEHARTGIAGWTAVTEGAGNTTIAVRQQSWEPHLKQQPGVLMNQSKHNPARYILAHEWGHATLQPKDRGPAYQDRLLHLYGTYTYHGSMYAGTSPDEFYAENFAEWHVSGGTTKDKVTQQMAMDFGWFMADKLSPDSGLKADRWRAPVAVDA